METNRKIEFTKIRDVKSPNRANKHDAGTDFYIPNYSEEFMQVLLEKNKGRNIEYQLAIDETGAQVCQITIKGGEEILIPSGIKVNILDKNTYLEATNKSGIASKFHLLTGACVIDADYQGEVHMNMHNVWTKPVTIVTGQKLVQFIHKYYIDTDWTEISNDEYNCLKTSDRGNGGFGSTTLK
jgi:deoxyuridine 5'-triphosphate nucleotidohydrolase